MIGDIYLIECPNNKKYIGQTVKFLNSGKKWGYLSRWKSHISEAKRNINYCRLLDNSIRKYGFENFKVSLICECQSFEEMNQKEIFYIQEYNSLSPNGYNLTTGGNENHIQSKETCLKKSESLKGKNLGKILLKRPRKNPEENNLPKYIRKIKDGYRISNHPSKIDRTFRSKKLTMENKLKLALDELERLNNGMQFID
jgi:group I intron endonuclease